MISSEKLGLLPTQRDQIVSRDEPLQTLEEALQCPYYRSVASPLCSYVPRSRVHLAWLCLLLTSKHTLAPLFSLRSASLSSSTDSSQSIPQTRLHFLKLLTGLSPTYPPARYTEASHGELAPSQRSSSTPDKTKRRAKDRVSSGATNENRRVSGAGPSENRRVSGSGAGVGAGGSPKASPGSGSKLSEEAKAARRARMRRTNPEAERLDRMDEL